MRIGIRAKLVVLLVAMALLPLLAALTTIVVGGRKLRSELFGQTACSLVKTEAMMMEFELLKDLELLQIALQERMVFHHLDNVEKKKSPEELKKLDKQWPHLPEDTGLLRRVLKNNTADILRNIVRENDLVVEVMITDRFGQLIAASGRTTDYYQADETWWKKTYNKGEGKIYIPSVHYDRSAKVWSVDLCIPIREDGEVIGVAKAVLDINRWLPECSRTIAGREGALLVLGNDGFILHSRDILEGKTKPLQARLLDWGPLTTVGPKGDWRVSGDGMLQAYASIMLPNHLDGLEVEMSSWTLLFYMPVSKAREGLTRLSIIMLLIGLISILILFTGGVFLIDRSLINRIKHLSQSARLVAEGELKHRADATWIGTRLFGKDEINDLSRDFNNMVRKLQRSHIELTEANQLKENFIRIAGHELRTPVSYIIGMCSLMKKIRDPERLVKAIDTMGFKAGRLDEIIQAMFKLIPEQTLIENIHFAPVNFTELFKSVEVDCKPWIERRKQTLEIDTGDSAIVILADEAKLRDIVENLAMNAIKFTPNGGRIKISAQRQLGGYVAIKVEDQGPGIPESDQPHIFEPFYSGSDTLKHSTGKSGYGKRGMGLGLAIVRHFVELHSGTIEFTTGPTGSTFIVHLPLEPPQNNQQG
ncbi:MAG: HAMP domain-containing protein [Phycisphaerae bacterium]|nr:HAMP domain-containing protein [Phycisphaerae bacterium]